MGQKARFVFDVEPKPQSRPRFNYINHHAYEDEKAKYYKRYVAFSAAAQMRKQHWKISEKPLKLAVQFLMPIPKSKTKKFKAAAIAGKKQHITKPDVDNLFKAVTDALNDLVYKDDNRIVSVLMEKKYGERPYIILDIEEIDEEE